MTNLKIILLFFVIGFLIYGNALFNGFVWDDYGQIIYNQNIHSVRNLGTILSGGTFDTGGGITPQKAHYKPLLSLTYSIIYSLFGEQTIYYHLVQVILHILNAVLLFYIFKYFFPSVKSLFLSLLFLVHPINVESVAYIAALQEPLYMFFGLTAFRLLQIAKPHINLTLLLFPLLLLSMLSKETGFLFLVVLLLFEIFQHNGKMFLYLFSASMALASFVVMIMFRPGNFLPSNAVYTSTNPFNQLTFIERIINIPQYFLYYLKTYFYPVDLSIAQYWAAKSLNWSNFFLPLLLVLSIIAVILWQWRRLRAKQPNYAVVFGFFSIWLLLGLALHMQIVSLNFSVAERWFYFPQIGLLGMVGVVWQTSNIKIKRYKRYIVALSVILLMLLSARTVIRNFDWKNEFTLSSHDLQVDPDNYYLEGMVGISYLEVNDFNQALGHLERSTKLYSGDWNNWNNIGAVHLKQGNLDQAVVNFKKALQNYPAFTAYENLSYTYYLKKDYSSAHETALKGMNLYPYNMELVKTLITSKVQLGDQQSALNYISKINWLSDPQRQKLTKLIEDTAKTATESASLSK